MLAQSGNSLRNDGSKRKVQWALIISIVLLLISIPLIVVFTQPNRSGKESKAPVIKPDHESTDESIDGVPPIAEQPDPVLTTHTKNRTKTQPTPGNGGKPLQQPGEIKEESLDSVDDVVEEKDVQTSNSIKVFADLLPMFMELKWLLLNNDEKYDQTIVNVIQEMQQTLQTDTEFQSLKNFLTNDVDVLRKLGVELQSMSLRYAYFYFFVFFCSKLFYSTSAKKKEKKIQSYQTNERTEHTNPHTNTQHTT